MHLVILFTSLIVALLLPVTTGARVISADLKNAPIEGNSAAANSQPYLTLPVQTVPKQDCDYPSLHAKLPLYSEVAVGGKTLAVVFDKSSAEGAFYDRLYIDINANQDLRDDQPLSAEPEQFDGYWLSVFKPTRLSSAGDEVTFAPIAFYSGGNPKNITTGNLHSKTCFFYHVTSMPTADIEFADKTYTFVFSDDNASGGVEGLSETLPANINRYWKKSFLAQKKAAPPEKPSPEEFAFSTLSRSAELSGYDRLLIQPEAAVRPYEMPFPDALIMKGQIYEVALDASQGTLSLSPLNESLGRLDCTGADFVLLWQENQGRRLAIIEPDAPVSIPAGTYQIERIGFLGKDARGETWLGDIVAQEDNQPIHIEADSLSRLPENPAGSPFQLIVPLTYEAYPKEIDWSKPRGYQSLQSLAEPPGGDWKIPQLYSELPIYALAEIGDNKHLMILDKTRKSDVAYNRLYFDENSNGDLTDDSERIVENPEEYHPGNFNLNFGLTDLEYSQEGKELSIRLLLSAYVYRPEERQFKSWPLEQKLNMTRIRLQSMCSYGGRIEINGMPITTALPDTDVNGFFGEAFSLNENQRPDSIPLYSSGDRLYMAKGSRVDYGNDMFFPHRLVIKDDVFDCQADIPAGRLYLSPVTGKMAKARLPLETEKISLCTSEDKKAIGYWFPEESIPLPSGEYQILYYRSSKDDAKDATWKLEARGMADGQTFKAEAGQSIEIPMGEPFAAKADIPEWAMNNFRNGSPEIRFDFILEGRGGERVSSLGTQNQPTAYPMAERSPSQPKEPAFKIATAEGAIVHQGSFEYG